MKTNRATKRQQTAVIYVAARTSFPKQAQTVQTQLSACRDWAEKHGYRVAKEYVENGKSAIRLEERVVLKELFADTVSKRRAFSLVIVYGFDRLFRNVLEFGIFQTLLKRECVQLVAATYPDDRFRY